MKIAARIAVLTAFVIVARLGADAPKLPTPEASFGFPPGADYKLATYDQTLAYFKKLDAASKYLTLVDAGSTTEGRPMYFALISSPENLSRIERYRQIALRLAHPAGLSDADARRLAEEGKAFVHIDGGLHATEVAGPQHTPLLAYDLLSHATEPETKAILDQVVLMLWPTINPDGQQMVAEWYMKNVGTPYELSDPPLLYQDYAGHDNNRDAYMLNMIESRVVEHAWRQWEPQVIYVHHQSGPFPTRIWLPPFSEPVATDAPYLMSREVNMIGMAIAKGLEEHGQVGATHMGTSFDAWYPGYIDYAPNFKNIAAFWTETALYEYATPHEYSLQDFPQNMRDLRPRSLYASPWPPGWWRLGDAVSYMETASWSVLEYASKYKESLLLNRYRAGRDQIRLGLKQAPYAYIIPQEQRDPVAAVELLRRLAFGGVHVSQLTAPAAVDDVTYPAGTWIVPTDQEFAALAREVLDIQKYPDLRQYPGGPPERPYDAAGWTLPLQMGVRVIPASRPISAEVRSKMDVVGSAEVLNRPATQYVSGGSDAALFDSVPGIGFNTNSAASAIVPPPGRLAGTGASLVVDPAENNAFRAINRAWKAGGAVRFAPANDSQSPRYILSGLSDDQQTDLVRTLALRAQRTDQSATVIPKAHIGVYEPWGGNMSAGWIRWTLEQYGFDYTTLRPADFHAPLTGRVDVVIMPNGARLRGGAGRAAPPTRPEYSDDTTPEDLAGFEQFVRHGGTLVCISTACSDVIQQFKLPVTNSISGLRPVEFFLRGSIVAADIDTASPLMAGMPSKAALFVDGSPVFETQPGFSGTVLAKYADSGSPLLSGYLIGEKYLAGKAAALDLSFGTGHIVLFGFRPEWRGQPFGSFRMLFNAALNVR
jgi:Zinc carboxypeptidase